MITVVGRHDGRDVVSFVLDHGRDPRAGLAARGWRAGTLVAEGSLGGLVLAYDVVSADPDATEPEPLGPGLGTADRVGVVPRQRVAAYAVVVEAGHLLLTQLSSRTGAEGRWTLPGGGIDPGESPAAAVVREVLEETGQVVEDVRLVDVMSAHWVGVSDRGPEDHHAVRLVHTARCPVPTDPVVHDIGGSTSDARWVPLAEVGGYVVVPAVPWALAAAGVTGHEPPA